MSDSEITPAVAFQRLKGFYSSMILDALTKAQDDGERVFIIAEAQLMNELAHKVQEGLGPVVLPTANVAGQ